MMIICRKDLKCRKGKYMAQAGHAVLKAFLDKADFPTKDYDEDWNLKHYNMTMNVPPEIYEWITGQQTKIAVSVDSEAELLDIYTKAKDEDLWCSLIQDAGKTEFHGVPTYTAVSILGEEKVVDIITRHLPLL